MKDLYFTGSSLDELKAFPVDAKREAGFQLGRVQHGLNPLDWKPMKTVGTGVREIRIRCADGAYRVDLHRQSCRCRLCASRISEKDPAHATAGH